MPFAADLAFKGLLILSAAAVAGFALRRRSAATKYLVWSTALMSLLVLPAFAALLPVVHAPVIPEDWVAAAPAPAQEPAAAPVADSPAAPARHSAPTAPIDDHTPQTALVAPTTMRRPEGAPTANAPEAPHGTTSAPRRVAPTAPASRAAPATAPPAPKHHGNRDGGAWFAALGYINASNGPAALFGGWLAGAALLLMHLVAGVSRVARLASHATESSCPHLVDAFDTACTRLSISRRVRLLQSDEASVPVTWEIWRPAVMLPAAATNWSAERLEVVLLHELAHVKRRDCQLWLLAHVATAVHWFNPLAWYALHRLRVEREHACDDHVLTLGTRASDYAGHLLDIARGLLRREPGWAAVPMARPSQLRGRVAAILDPENPRRLPDRRTTMIATFTTLALLLPLAALQPGIAAQAPNPGPTAKPGAAPMPEPSPSPAAAPAASPAQSTQPTIDELVSMRIHGVTPEFIAGVRASIGGNLTIDDFIAFRIHGVDDELAASMRAAFGDDLDGDDLVSARIHGVSPEYAERMADFFGSALDFDTLISMRIHGANPEYVEQMQPLLPDGDTLSADDVISMRIHGVSVSWVRELREDGYTDLTADELVSIKIHGLDRILKRRRGGQ